MTYDEIKSIVALAAILVAFGFFAFRCGCG